MATSFNCTLRPDDDDPFSDDYEDFTTVSYQFADSSDRNVTPQFIEANWDRLGPIMGWLTDRLGLLPTVIPESCLDKGWYIDRIRNGLEISELSRWALDEDICRAYLETAEQPRDVDASFMDYELCLDVVKRWGDFLQYVPEDWHTKELVLAAVASRGSAIRFAIDGLREDHDVCRAAVAQEGFALEFTPWSFWEGNGELCLAAVKACGWAYERVPAQFEDREIRLKAVRRAPAVFGVMDECHMDEEICLVAVESGVYLGDILERFRSLRVMKAAAMTNGMDLRMIPPEDRDRETCMAAVEVNANAILWVPDSVLNRDIVLEAITFNPSILATLYAHRKDYYGAVWSLVDDDMIGLALRIRPTLLGHLPEAITDRVVDRPTSQGWNASMMDGLVEELKKRTSTIAPSPMD